MTRFVAADGTTVEVMTLSLTGGPRYSPQRQHSRPGDGKSYQVRSPYGSLRGYSKTIDGLAELGVDSVTRTAIRNHEEGTAA